MKTSGLHAQCRFMVEVGKGTGNDPPEPVFVKTGQITSFSNYKKYLFLEIIHLKESFVVKQISPHLANLYVQYFIKRLGQFTT